VEVTKPNVFRVSILSGWHGVCLCAIIRQSRQINGC